MKNIKIITTADKGGLIDQMVDLNREFNKKGYRSYIIKINKFNQRNIKQIKEGDNVIFQMSHYGYQEKGNAIDIGCNRGLYSYALSKEKKIKDIFSFEPNKSILKDLYDYNAQNIKIFNFALSDVSKSQSLIIPYFKNFELDGFATLNRKIYYNKKFRKFRKIKVKTKKLDSFNFKNISFIKIDVEGHEINLLNGSKATFKLNKPDCLIEVKKGNLPKVKKFFESIDSKYYCVPKKKFAFKFSRENYFFSRKH